MMCADVRRYMCEMWCLVHPFRSDLRGDINDLWVFYKMWLRFIFVHVLWMFLKKFSFLFIHLQFKKERFLPFVFNE